MPGVLFEGGTFRAAFSSGVMDALLDKNIIFPYCIGVSAGCANAASYISKQRGRNLEVIEKYRNDKRYMGRRNLWKEHSMFGVNFVFREISNTHVPFDMKTFQEYTGKFVIVTTDAQTGETHYFGKEDVTEDFEVLHATCALPVVIPPAVIDGREYFDGGLSNPIPIDKLMADGNKRALVVLTRPKGYIKACRKIDIMAARHFEKRYPEISREIVNRYRRYNHSVKVCEKLEKEGKIVLLRPDGPIDSMEKDVRVLRQTWQSGYDQAMKKMDQIRTLFEE